MVLKVFLSLWIGLSGVSQVFAFSPEISGFDLVKSVNFKAELKKVKSGTVLVFLSARCPCSNSHIGTLNTLYSEFGKEFTFIGVHSNANESQNMAQDYFKKSGLNFSVVQDNGAKIADEYKAFKTPHVYVLGPTQEVLFQGGVDNSKVANNATEFYLKDALTDIRAGKKPKQKEVRVLGCEIKRP